MQVVFSFAATTVPPGDPSSGPSLEFKVSITIVYAVIFVIAFLGNSFGLYVVIKKSSFNQHHELVHR